MSRPRAQARAFAAAALLACAAVSAWSFSRHFEGGLSFEFCHYAEIGRNLLDGRGLTSAAVYPSTLAYFDARGIAFSGSGPVLDRFPLPAFAAALFEAVLGRRDAAIAWLSALQLAACAAAAVLAGAWLFSAEEGLVAGLFVAFDPSFQRAFVLWGLPDFGFALLALATALLIVRGMEDDAGAAIWAAAGICAGLMWLDRYNSMLWLPFFAAAALSRRRLAPPLWLAACFGAVASPAILYNLRWFGGPTPPNYAWANLAHHVVVDTEPWLSYRLYGPGDILARLPRLWLKWRVYLRLYLTNLPSWWQMQLVFPLAAVGAWSAWRGTDGRAARWTKLTLLMLGSQLLAFSALRYETLGPRVGGRYFLWLAPAAFLWAARGASALGERFGARRAALAAFAAANLAWFSYFLFATPQGASAYPGGLAVSRWPELAAAAEAAGPAGLVATNLPGQVAWYADRPAVALPPGPQEWPALTAKHPVSAILLSRVGAGELGNLPGWTPLARDPHALEGFARARHFEIVKDFGTAVVLKAR